MPLHRQRGSVKATGLAALGLFAFVVGAYLTMIALVVATIVLVLKLLGVL